ncbi:UvrD-helicase domain-containing protein [Pseudodesulfovibrio sp. zrk46]|uniref:UvrD-helicase domain-containing protein n=1 Tax=Pseudodesulfovibrio sp. zrk46 TaxID=2725288 RepID=UPI00144929BD|nr:UvrD-helicase domain-containing protein [Pseudodesulfovibrio sp. zrk46]QJB57917.1 UvrD-helicase domain-containing protein [Pseudodesulfovibrio sp. zrk46]
MSQLKQVKASAGSGKTYQLTRRFLSLLDKADENKHAFTCTVSPHKGYAWPEIMAVTFTNKAATEMKERVVSGLKHAALDLGDQMTDCSPQTASRAIDSILRRYHRLNIRTIDSLLALLLRLFALEFGIRPDFQMIFDESEMFDAVYDHFVLICEEDGLEHELLAAAMDTMIRSEGRSGFWMQDMIRRRLLDLTRFLRTESGPLLTDQEEIKALLTAAYADFQQTVKCTLEYFADTGLPFAKRFIDFLMNSQDLGLFDPPKDSAYIKKESLRDCVNKKGKDDVNSRAEAEYAHLKEAWQTYATNHAALTGAYFLAPAVEIALRLLNGLNHQQKEQGLILGSSLAGFVNELLTYNEAVSEAYCRLGCRLHHLLVDEFQDTSREQWQAITPLSQECLAKGGSLYYVGDVKQAIYGWRGGDSALFDEVLSQPDLASLALNSGSDTLPNNWRSFRNVVEFNNEFFRNFENIIHASDLADTLFKDAPDNFRASFADDLTGNFEDCAQAIPPQNEESEGYVRMTRLPGGRNEEIEEQALVALDELIDELTKRRYFRDIAILVRTHGHASLVCDLLVQKDIPVITENSLQLDRHPIIRQLAGLLGFLDFPRDDVAFLTFAAGNELFLAETGITEEEFHNWLIKPKKRPLGVCFRDDYPDQWQQFIEPFYNQSGLMTPYDLTREAIRTFRVLERHPDAELYVRRFLEVVHLAEENGYGSLSAFLEYWDEKSGEEKVPLPENIDAVRIMTIHKSKGLEFPVVIVPFHNWAVRPDQDYLIRKVKGQRILTPMKKGMGKPYLTSMGRAVREQLNLLYVAWTRAREELYGFFTEKPVHYPALAALNLFLDLEEDEIFEYGTLPQDGEPSPPPPKPEPQQLDKGNTENLLMEWLPRLRVYRHNRDEFFYNEKMRGEVAHRVMEHLRLTGNDEEDTNRAVLLALQDFPILAALDEETMQNLDSDLRTMTRWALTDDNLRRWLDKGDREPEIMDAEGNFKRLDLLYRQDKTVVVDFKTGQPTPKNREQVLDYMNILKEMDPTCEPSGYLVYFDLQEIHEVAEDV